MVTDRATCHQALSASASKEGFRTGAGGAAISIERSMPAGLARAGMSRSGRADRRARAIDHLADLTHQCRHVIGNAVLDGPLDAAAAHHLNAIPWRRNGVVGHL